MGSINSKMKNHCPGCNKSYYKMNFLRKTRKCEMDGEMYCKKCTKIIVIENDEYTQHPPTKENKKGKKEEEKG